MRNLIFLFSLITSLTAAAEALTVKKGAPVVIAVIDSGLGTIPVPRHVRLCKFGHRDFSGANEFQPFQGVNDAVPTDKLGHGTNIAGVISRFANMTGVSYCLVILKIYPSENPLKSEIEAVTFATNIGANMINLSGGGKRSSTDENNSVKKFLNTGGIFVAAAGNEKTELTKTSKHYFPAQSDDRVVVVGNMKKDLSKSLASNYGSAVTRWEYGENVEGFGIIMTGTSQATAVATGKMLGEVKIRYDRVKIAIALRK